MTIRIFYPLLIVLTLLLAVVVAPFQRKVRRGFWPRVLAGRGLRASYARRDHQRPLVWFHAASAGELLQAEPVMRRLRERGVQLVVSLSSITAMGWLSRLKDWPEVVWSGLLPPDFPWAAEGWLRNLRPTALVHLQADLWPGLVVAAHGAGVPQMLMAARVGRSGNYRARPWLRGVYRALYGRMGLILCVTEEDRAGIGLVVPGHPGLEVGGDPGIETVLTRVDETEVSPALRAWAGAAPVLVLGSIWPADEAVILPGILEAARALPDLRVVAAPHDPEEGALRSLAGRLAGLGVERLSDMEGRDGAGGKGGGGGARVVLVDGVGRLASLYRLGAVAYVGGGFTTGVHNVAEPAAGAEPVLFGPRHGNTAVAAALLRAGAAVAVRDGAEFGAALLTWLENPEARVEAGRQARKVVEGLAGGAEISFQALSGLATELGEPSSSGKTAGPGRKEG